MGISQRSLIETKHIYVCYCLLDKKNAEKITLRESQMQKIEK